jgi:hypothetical protein
MTLARPYAAPINPLYFGRSAEGTRTAMMVCEPENSPAAPIPHIARPMIKATELGAAPDCVYHQYTYQALLKYVNLPQITLPNSKRKMETRYVHLRGKIVYDRPQSAVVAAVVMKKAEPYHPISWRLLNLSVILGMAAEMIVCASSQALLAIGERRMAG